MKSKYLKIKAGPKAKEILLNRGIQASDIRIIPAAAGGPKWLILYHLDKYIFGDWIKASSQKINLIGASAGAWRMACAAQTASIEAFDIFCKEYVEQRYEDVPTPKEVSQTCNKIIRDFLGNDGISQILEASRYHLHVVTSNSVFNYSPEKLKQKLLISAAHNVLARKNLNKYFHRNVFSTNTESICRQDEITSHHHKLTEQNLFPALLASGAIPSIIDPVKNIGHEGQVHWDGGITDYHLDLDYDIDDGIIFYPHFHSKIIPGWFDKYLKIRTAKKNNLDRVVLLYPSKAFIDMLPRKLISTRKDFDYYFKKDDSRIAYWKEIIEKSKYLVDDFHNYSNGPISPEEIISF